ncbi:MAG: metallophosphoesterase family protein [Verrucomicrobia bacterium]|nr:metallophosphoesterase family protein [Verrucomicrobiota bacterium]
MRTTFSIIRRPGKSIADIYNFLANDCLGRLETLAPVFTVRGNGDYQFWCGSLPNTLTISLGELRLCMIHDLLYLDQNQLKDILMVIYGHSHRPEIVELNQVVYLNPGSAGPRRFSLPVTVARLNWERGQEKLSPELIQLL